MIAEFEALPFPTLAAVQGMCVGGGLELVLACDLIWAAASARFGQLEATIGTTTLLGGVQRLAERAGSNRAREIIYTADQYDAATFERWNIVNRVVPDEAFEAQTRAFAERLANGPTLAYAAGKRIIRAYLTAAYMPQIRLLGRSGRPCFRVKICAPQLLPWWSTALASFATRSSFKGVKAIVCTMPQDISDQTSDHLSGVAASTAR